VALLVLAADGQGWAAEALASRPLLQAALTAPKAEGAAIFARLSAKPTHRRARVAALDRAAFQAGRLRLDLFPDVVVEAESMDVGFTGVEGRTWTGRLADGGSAAFVMRGDRVVGSIATAKGNFQVFPLGDGLCAVVEHDPSTLPDCGTGRVLPPAELPGLRPPVVNPLDQFGPIRSRRKLAGPGEAQLADTPTANRVRVLVAYTPGAQSLTSLNLGMTMQELVDLAILESNQGYANSGVTMRMELAFLYETAYDETAAIENDVTRFRGNGDGFMDEVHAHRTNYDADMCCLIVDGTDPDWCGWAFGFDYTDAANMFQASHYGCVTGNFTFAHEFGHNQGCRHDNDGTLTPFAYGHGFRNGNSWRTIMAVAGTSTAPRLNYWSNPNVNSPVSPFTAMGTAINGANFANDCRSALNAGDDVVVNHELTPLNATTPVGATIASDEVADKLVTGTLTATSFTANSGSRVQLRAGTGISLGTGVWARQGSSFRARLATPLGDAPPVATQSSDPTLQAQQRTETPRHQEAQR
jgi:hypothetical protein